MIEETGTTKIIQRDQPEVNNSRKALVTAWTERVQADKSHWSRTFKKMRDDQKFARGEQWPKTGLQPSANYVSNVTLRHIQQRVAQLYAKNPKVVAKRRERITSLAWDGTATSYMMARQAIDMATEQAMMTGMPPMIDPNSMAVIEDFERVRQANAMLDKIGRTLEILYEYNIDEQAFPFKDMLKLAVRRAVTTGVAYVKVGYQRAMKMRPEIEQSITDFSERLATIERISADIADGETQTDSAEAEQLRTTIEALKMEPQVLVREGLAFDFPSSTAVIPHKKCKVLRSFIGCEWVTEEYLLTPDEVKEVYKIDVGKNYTAYKAGSVNQSDLSASSMTEKNGDVCCVWEIYSRKDRMVYVVCDGYPDFLVEPSAPDIWLERFWPWFPLVFNECDDEDNPYPPSDVELMRHPQQEINRARQGLREHRRAARPKVVTAAGLLSEEDKDKLLNSPDLAILELTGLQPQQKVDDLLQGYQGPGIDPNLYDIGPAFEDILRTVGTQEADFGTTGGATATESSIAASSRSTAAASTVDEMDMLLTQLARAAGQILLKETSAETVKEIVGEGAVWPTLSIDQIAKEIYLEIEAGSSGRPNQAQEIQNMTQLMPFMMQLPGVNPEFLVKTMLTRLDDRLDVTQALMPGQPSVVAANSQKGGTGQPSGEGGASAPSSQAAEGSVNAAPRPPGQTTGMRADQPAPQQGQAMLVQ